MRHVGHPEDKKKKKMGMFEDFMRDFPIILLAWYMPTNVLSYWASWCWLFVIFYCLFVELLLVTVS